MKRTICSLFAATALLALNPRILAAQDANTNAHDSQNYQVRTGDMLSISIFREPDLTTQLRVEADGTSYFRFLGQIAVAGKTLSELTEHLHELYNRDYLVNPQITLNIVEFAPLRVNVIGEVQSPGIVTIPIDEKLTVLDAISRAGGFTRRAFTKKLQLRRIDEQTGKVVNQEIDLSKFAKGKGADSEVELQDRDTIFVSESIW